MGVGGLPVFVRDQSLGRDANKDVVGWHIDFSWFLFVGDVDGGHPDLVDGPGFAFEHRHIGS